MGGQGAHGTNPYRHAFFFSIMAMTEIKSCSDSVCSQSLLHSPLCDNVFLLSCWIGSLHGNTKWKQMIMTHNVGP